MGVGTGGMCVLCDVLCSRSFLSKAISDVFFSSSPACLARMPSLSWILYYTPSIFQENERLAALLTTRELSKTGTRQHLRTSGLSR